MFIVEVLGIIGEICSTDGAFQLLLVLTAVVVAVLLPLAEILPRDKSVKSGPAVILGSM